MWIRRSKYRKIMSELMELRADVSYLKEQQYIFSNGEECGRGSLDYMEGMFPTIESVMDSNSRSIMELKKELKTIIAKINEYIS